MGNQNPEVKPLPKWVLAVVCTVTAVAGIATAYAIALPSERDQLLIEWGQMEGQQIELNQQNDDLRALIDDNSKLWHELEVDQALLYDQLF
jgi:hypothetical protein